MKINQIKKICNPPLKTLPEDASDFCMTQQDFEKIDQKAWDWMLADFVGMQTPLSKRHFLNDNKTQEEQLVAFKAFTRSKGSLKTYFENYLASLNAYEAEAIKNEQLPEDQKKQRFEDKEALVKHLMDHPKSFKFLKKSGTLTADTINLTVFGRGPVFRVIDTRERNALTLYHKSGEILDISRNEIFQSSEGTYKILGPHLCIKDAKILAALLIAHTHSLKQGLDVQTTYSELTKILGLSGKSKLGDDTRRSIRRSLVRISSCTVYFAPENKKSGIEFCGSIFNYGGTYQNGSPEKIEISFNKNLIAHFVFGAFSCIDMNLVNAMSNWETKLALYLSTHAFGTPENPMKFGIETLKEKIAPKSDHYDISFESFRKRMSEAVKGLIKKGFLDPASGLKNGVYTFIKAPRKPFVQQPLKRVAKPLSQNYKMNL